MLRLHPPNLASGEQEQLWPFHVMAAYGPPEEGGIEDVMWARCLKAVGNLPSVPGYEVLVDNELSEPDDDRSVFLAYKQGPNPVFTKLGMLSASFEHEAEIAPYLKTLKLGGVSDAIFRQAPAEICSR